MAKESIKELSMKKDTIRSDGLRYEVKQSTTPFFGGNTTSCTKCGVHKLRKLGSFVHKFGGRLFVCYECKPKK